MLRYYRERSSSSSLTLAVRATASSGGGSGSGGSGGLIGNRTTPRTARVNEDDDDLSL